MIFGVLTILQTQFNFRMHEISRKPIQLCKNMQTVERQTIEATEASCTKIVRMGTCTLPSCQLPTGLNGSMECWTGSHFVAELRIQREYSW